MLFRPSQLKRKYAVFYGMRASEVVAGLAAEDEDADSEAVLALMNDLKRVRQDNLGRDTIIY